MSINQISKIKEHIFGAMVAFILVGLAYTYIVSQSEFIKSTNDTPSPIVGITGEFVEYCRDIEYIRDSDASVIKILIKNNLANITIIPLGEAKIYRLKGFKDRICKTLFLDYSIPPGTWTLETYIKRKQFPFWEQIVQLKDIEIIIGSKE